MSTLFCMNWLLWSLRVVHSGAHDSSSFPLLHTGRALAVTSMPVCNRPECKGTVDTRMPFEDCTAIQ